jgi:RNA polymerase sigma-70 factor (ECF subfamily)
MTTIDITDLETHRAALTGHCYRMLGSSADAEDAVQETFVRAWRSLERFEGRSSVRTWLHRIATNVCLDTLSSSERRARPFEEGPSGKGLAEELVARERSHWLEPIPDARAIPSDADPHHQAVLRQSIRLAFVAALQHLPPRQRAAVILTEVLGWSAAEVADCLETTVPAINSALQRARATLGKLGVIESDDTLSDEQSALLERYIDAFHRYDVDALVGLLRHDATLSMPPYTLWLQGPETIREWLLGPGCGCRGSKLIPVRANGLPAFAQYRRGEAEGTYQAWALIVLELGDDGIAAWNSFLDVETVFPLFGMPLRMDR